MQGNHPKPQTLDRENQLWRKSHPKVVGYESYARNPKPTTVGRGQMMTSGVRRELAVQAGTEPP